MSTGSENFTDDEEEFEVESIISLSPVRANVEEEQDDSIMTLRGHNGPVYAVDIHHFLVASGGGDDVAFVYDIRDGDTLIQCFGHQDSVFAVKFNRDATLVATGDLMGRIQIWDMTTLGLECSYETHDDLQWMVWHHSIDIIIRGGNSGNIYMNQIHSQNMKILVGHGESCTAGKVMDDRIHLIAGYSDGIAKVWNMRDESYKSVQAGTSAISCIDYRENVALVGSTFGDVVLFNHQTAEVYHIMQLAHSAATEGMGPASVETVGFAPSIPVYFAGGFNEMLHLYDAATNEIRHTLNHPGCVMKAVWVGNTVISSCSDGVLRMWDGLSGREIRSFHGHLHEIYDFVVNEYFLTEQLILSCDSSGICKVFRLR
ncbi:putative WD domain, G-beta repeat protein [Trichinella nativa]|uniref:Putative WD domain, G-beta repeat protein n=1 Tax=Trichinella nativa TaxID=6335 RepID=A0A1Y3E6C3_9BILA|nr:putative WD domain, G-beta repeat protein [Trichinella nativa]